MSDPTVPAQGGSVPLPPGPSPRSLAAKLKAMGALDDMVEHAFATVERHRFLGQFLCGRWYDLDGADSLSTEALAVVYADNPLALKLHESGQLISSTTLPSLLARKLTALQLSPGMRVLEVGAGIGYNAALIHAITDAEVVTVDVQPDVVADAEAALQRCGIRDVHAVLGDGYRGYPAGAPYDRILASCGIRGVPPAWFDQLAPSGFILAPFAHGGAHPVVRFHLDNGRPRVTAVGPWTDFMLAIGSLYQDYPGAHPARYSAGPFPTPSRDRRWPVSLACWDEYADLWFQIAVHSSRITQARHLGLDPDRGAATLLASGSLSAATVQTDGFSYASGPDGSMVAEQLGLLIDGWTRAGRPRIRDWAAPMQRLDLPMGPLLVPFGWTAHPTVNRDAR